MSIGIYKITSPSNKIYIGQSINIEERFRKYNTLKCKRQIKLYNSFIKYGVENHKFEIIYECNINELDEREVYWGTIFNVLKEGLNLRLGNGRGSVSEETKNKISKALLNQPKSEIHCLNLSKSKKGIPSKRKGKSDLKQKGISKPGAGGKGKSHLGAGPKQGNHILNISTNKTYKSVMECMSVEKISKRKMFNLLKDPNSNFQYINKSYFKNGNSF